ncbi:hypothetical protein AAFP35_04930 [Gordonia sp. CPCC 206044]|uniref:WXG100-like domain-containing protein n=1 Tax=Gordonia sp. CPCC 206044 TaxID=3140793 RepID=UPI003AF3B644
MPAAVTWPLGLVGMEWPKGDETAMDRLNHDWEQFAHKVELIRTQLDSVASGVGHSVEGDMQKALDAQLSSLLSGDLSLDKLVDQANDIADCCDTMSTEIFVLKLIFITELVALAAYVAFLIATSEVNWSAPIEIAEAIFAGRMTLTEAINLVVRRIMAKLLEKGIEQFATTSTKEMAKLLGKDLVSGLGAKAFDGAIVEGANKLAFTTLAQVRDNVLWEKPIDPKEVIAKSAASAATGALFSPLSRKAESIIGTADDRLKNRLSAAVAAPEGTTRTRDKVTEVLGNAAIKTGTAWGNDKLPSKVVPGTGPADKALGTATGPAVDYLAQPTEQTHEDPHSVAPDSAPAEPTASPSATPTRGDSMPTTAQHAPSAPPETGPVPTATTAN